MITRRAFVGSMAGAGCWLLTGRSSTAGARPATVPEALVEARYYKKLPNRKIQCTLCPRGCLIDDLERGYCGVRENRSGTYYSLVYGRPCSIHVDPIEKKPFFHFLPARKALSLATAGCNVFCKFCQNWEISQSRPEQVESVSMPPDQVATLAVRQNCPVLAFTYNEPVVFAEYMSDIARAAGQHSLRSVMISNGYIQKEPMLDLCKILAAVKIDLKAFSERFYRELVDGQLQPVLDTLILLRQQKIWFEVVYLVLPGENDAPEEIAALCRWMIAQLGPDVPLHFTRFYPQYRMTNLPPTPIKTLQQVRNIALEAGVHFVYTGNVPGDAGENTYCPGCGKLLIGRMGYTVTENHLKSGNCPGCGRSIPGVWY
ncbi:MAG TPA: AmmeMemoRadiSam system radical SAM enzyme [bacterium]|nr:AmmeMemoRadiSam system radical SAM enzyme [bacterium]HQG44214.1 AmmeMemoRadiSam system radical SAM enzyme [bacterium]HQI48805.1 AmmeMemoRadiSam system radical SAM enzyme [bacterium]HQJ66057.1 AmmeMemoRadiSam system radical SAM enzyme [bacterium]